MNDIIFFVVQITYKFLTLRHCNGRYCNGKNGRLLIMKSRCLNISKSAPTFTYSRQTYNLYIYLCEVLHQGNQWDLIVSSPYILCYQCILFCMSLSCHFHFRLVLLLQMLCMFQCFLLSTETILQHFMKVLLWGNGNHNLTVVRDCKNFFWWFVPWTANNICCTSILNWVMTGIIKVLIIFVIIKHKFSFVCVAEFLIAIWLFMFLYQLYRLHFS